MVLGYAFSFLTEHVLGPPLERGLGHAWNVAWAMFRMWPGPCSECGLGHVRNVTWAMFGMWLSFPFEQRLWVINMALGHVWNVAWAMFGMWLSFPFEQRLWVINMALGHFLEPNRVLGPSPFFWNGVGPLFKLGATVASGANALTIRGSFVPSPSVFLRKTKSSALLPFPLRHSFPATMSGTSRKPSLSVEAPTPYRARERYDWVSGEVRMREPKLLASVVRSLDKDGWWCTIAHRRCFRMEQCTPYERVCYAAEEGQDDFVYMVLRILGLAPTQLHPNGWAAIQAFRVACKALSIIPSAPLFLCFYSSRLTKEVGWVSLTPIASTPKGGLFAPYTDSYKGFKNRFLKIVSIGSSPFSTDTEPFPLYWKFPVRFAGFTPSDLTPSEHIDLRYLEGLPRNMDCKNIVPLVFERGSSALFAGIVESQNANIHSYLQMVRNKKKEPTGDSSTPSNVATNTPNDQGSQQPQSSSSRPSDTPFGRVTSPDKGKRKAAPADTEKASKKGKAQVDTAADPSPTAPPSEAPPVKSLWNGEPAPWDLLPAKTVRVFNQHILAPHDVQKTFDMLGLYHLRSMAALAYWRQALAEMDPEELKRLKAENERLLADANRFRSIQDELQASLKLSQADSESKAAEIAALREELQREKGTAATVIAGLEESWKLKADKALAAAAQVSDLRKALSDAEEANRKLVKQVSDLEDVALGAYQGGFDNALSQVSLLSPGLDLSSCNVELIVIDGKLTTPPSL
ncbi:hypothetical protein CR513_53679, partial [Mucuna pruriens]